MNKSALVITSIAAPNAALKAFADGAKKNGVDFIVIGDTKSPADFQLEGCEFYSVEKQLSLDIPFAKAVPLRHYSRKNIGYLLAKERNVILESDDDNFPTDKFWQIPEKNIKARHTSTEGWINVYSHFTEKHIWPRGFPLEFLQNQKIATTTHANVNAPIHQGLADENPDVDAVYRMTQTLPVRFDQHEPSALGKNSWCPFNSQNTIWHKEAFPLLYLPSHCTFRMTDIWRSFVAQRIAWENNWSLVFHSPTVWQERNEHNLLADFKDEIPGYTHNASMCEMLSSLELRSGKEFICNNLLTCYSALTEKGFIGKEEMDLLRLWIAEFE